MPELIEEPGCAICREPLTTDTDSNEHVIPQAIGGRLEVRGFICRRCNSGSGHTWDATLTSQLHPLSLLFGVNRERGSTPGLSIVTTAGEELEIRPEGGFIPTKPTYLKEASPEGAKIKIVARSIEEAKDMLAGVKRKYPSVDVDQILATAEVSTTYPQGLVRHDLAIGGESSGRAITKSALAMAHHAGIPASACLDALNYLRQATGAPCFGYYQATDLIVNRPVEVPINCVSVEANPATGLVLGYVEYFGIFRIVVCLGRQYTADLLRACYAIDPRTGTELDLSIPLGFSEAEIDAIYNYEMIPDGAIQRAAANVMPAALRKKFESERDRAIKQAVEFAFANCGAKPGEILTEEQIKKLPQLMMEKLRPFLLHVLSPKATEGVMAQIVKAITRGS